MKTIKKYPPKDNYTANPCAPQILVTCIHIDIHVNKNIDLLCQHFIT